MIGACRLLGSWASGTRSAAAGSDGTHCCAPAGLVVSTHSYLNRLSRYSVSHVVGRLVQVPSRPLVIVSAPLPLPWRLFQPKPCSSRGAPSVSGPRFSAGAAPWALPTVWPPITSAAVSSSFIAMRPNVSRMSRADARASATPLGPSGFT